jgi:hypothetical protein
MSKERFDIHQHLTDRIVIGDHRPDGRHRRFGDVRPVVCGH